MLRCTLLGIGAMASPRYAPAGLLIGWGPWRVMLDGGPGEAGRDAVPDPHLRLDAWLVSDAQSELQPAIRRLARERSLEATLAAFVRPGLMVEPFDVRHTNHRTVGYRISAGPDGTGGARSAGGGTRPGRGGAPRRAAGPDSGGDAGGSVVAWAPEFLELPDWVAGADVLFAEASSWTNPIRFARGAGGHAAVLQVAGWARHAGVRRLVFAHLGRPTLRALDRGERPPFGEVGVEGRTYEVG